MLKLIRLECQLVPRFVYLDLAQSHQFAEILFHLKLPNLVQLLQDFFGD